MQTLSISLSLSLNLLIDGDVLENHFSLLDFITDEIILDLNVLRPVMEHLVLWKLHKTLFLDSPWYHGKAQNETYPRSTSFVICTPRPIWIDKSMHLNIITQMSHKDISRHSFAIIQFFMARFHLELFSQQRKYSAKYFPNTLTSQSIVNTETGLLD